MVCDFLIFEFDEDLVTFKIVFGELKSSGLRSRVLGNKLSGS